MKHTEVIRTKLMAIISMAILWSGASGMEAESKHPNLILCGAEEVFVSPYSDPSKKIWTWRAQDSPEIPKERWKEFNTTDECKPYAGGLLLITSSSGGVAVIDRKSKSCLFFASARNAHSACFLPGGYLAVASSFGGDELLIFDRKKSGGEPEVRVPLHGAHGVHWEGEKQFLWALGDRELFEFRIGTDASDGISLSVARKWSLPSPGGHDLSPVPGKREFFISTDSEVLVFSAESGSFAPHPEIGKKSKVKSIDQAGAVGPIVYQQASVERWWSHEIRVLDTAKTLRFPEERLYKVRWDIPADIPE